MNLKELRARFQSVANTNASVETFVFDDLSAINTNRQKKYPVLLLKTPNAVRTRRGSTGNKTQQYRRYQITLYYLKPWTVELKKTMTLDMMYDECIREYEGYLNEFLALGTNVYFLDPAVESNMILGHHQHVDQLVGLSDTFDLMVYDGNC